MTGGHRDGLGFSRMCPLHIPRGKGCARLCSASLVMPTVGKPRSTAVAKAGNGLRRERAPGKGLGAGQSGCGYPGNGAWLTSWAVVSCPAAPGCFR